jgi:hypothetical protein
MGWPKGMPRKGYIKANGEPHAAYGSRIITLLSGKKTAKETAPRKRKPDADAAPVEPVLHGMVGSGPVTEVCPMCMYAYADGGYCQECGWMKPFIRHPYGSITGRRIA